MAHMYTAYTCTAKHAHPPNTHEHSSNISDFDLHANACRLFIRMSVSRLVSRFVQPQTDGKVLTDGYCDGADDDDVYDNRCDVHKSPYPIPDLSARHTC